MSLKVDYTRRRVRRYYNLAELLQQLQDEVNKIYNYSYKRVMINGEMWDVLVEGDKGDCDKI